MSERSPILMSIFTGFLGAIAGSAVGQIVHKLWPGTAAADLLGASIPFGFVEPLRADLGVLHLSFGLALRLNLPAVVGLIAGGWLGLRRP